MDPEGNSSLVWWHLGTLGEGREAGTELSTGRQWTGSVRFVPALPQLVQVVRINSGLFDTWFILTFPQIEE